MRRIAFHGLVPVRLCNYNYNQNGTVDPLGSLLQSGFFYFTFYSKLFLISRSMCLERTKQSQSWNQNSGNALFNSQEGVNQLTILDCIRRSADSVRQR